MAEIKKLNSNEEFLDFTGNSSSLNVVKIGSSWCGPCRVLEGIINALTPEEVEGVLLAEIDADDEWFEDKSAELKIRGIPVLLAYKDGVEKDRVQGGQTKTALLEFIARNK